MVLEVEKTKLFDLNDRFSNAMKYSLKSKRMVFKKKCNCICKRTFMDSTKCPFIKNSVAKCPFVALHVSKCPYLKDKFNEVASTDKDLVGFYGDALKIPVIREAFDKCTFLHNAKTGCPFFDKIENIETPLPPLSTQVNAQGLLVPTV